MYWIFRKARRSFSWGSWRSSKVTLFSSTSSKMSLVYTVSCLKLVYTYIAIKVIKGWGHILITAALSFCGYHIAMVGLFSPWNFSVESSECSSFSTFCFSVSDGQSLLLSYHYLQSLLFWYKHAEKLQFTCYT